MNFVPSFPLLSPYFSDPKKYTMTFPGQVPLFSMSMYEAGSTFGIGEPFLHQPPQTQGDSFLPHPLRPTSDEFKDLTLKEILELSDDLLADDCDGDEDYYDDPLMTTPILEPSFSVPPPVLSSAVSNAIVCPISPHSSTSSSKADSSTKKRRRGSTASSTIASSSIASTPRFREYQAGQWSAMFDELSKYKAQHGDCMVPYTYKENRPLARWVKRQRYQYKLWKEGQSSTMTPDRARALTNLGFCWDSQTSNWMDRLEELKEFKLEHGHCNVPSQYLPNTQLSLWCKCQRRQYKLMKERKTHNITPERIALLDEAGFIWKIRAPKRQRLA